MLQVTFTYDAEDAAALQAENSRGMGQVSGGTYLLFMGLSLLPMTLLLAGYGQWGVLTICWGVVVGGIGLLWLWARLSPQETAPAIPLETTFRFTPEAAEEAGQDYLVRLSWQGIHDVRLTERHLVIEVESTEWVAPHRYVAVVPLRAFADEAEVRACIDYCRARIAEGAAQAIAPLASRPDLFPAAFPGAWQADALELRYRHAENSAGLLDPDGQEAKRGLSQILSMSSAALFTAIGLGAVAFALHQSPGAEASGFGAVGFSIVPWFVLMVLYGIHRAFAPLQPPARVNSQVLLLVHSQGIYFRTDLSEGFLPSQFVPEIDGEEEGEYLFFRGPDGNIWRAIPRAAFRDEQQMQNFHAAVEASRQGVVMAQRVSRVPPSDNPYRPPEVE